MKYIQDLNKAVFSDPFKVVARQNIKNKRKQCCRIKKATDVAAQTGDSLATTGLHCSDFKHNTICTELRSLYETIKHVVTPLDIYKFTHILELNY